MSLVILVRSRLGKGTYQTGSCDLFTSGTLERVRYLCYSLYNAQYFFCFTTNEFTIAFLSSSAERPKAETSRGSVARQAAHPRAPCHIPPARASCRFIEHLPCVAEVHRESSRIFLRSTAPAVCHRRTSASTEDHDCRRGPAAGMLLSDLALGSNSKLSYDVNVSRDQKNLKEI